MTQGMYGSVKIKCHFHTLGRTIEQTKMVLQTFNDIMWIHWFIRLKKTHRFFIC